MHSSEHSTDTKWKKISTGLGILLILSVLGNLADIPINTTSHVIPLTAEALAAEVLPEDGVVLPITWGDIGQRMIEHGVIDADKIEQLYANRGGMSSEMQTLLYGNTNKNVVLNQANASELLNIFWAFGLANKSPILEQGLMTTYDGNMSSTREEALAKAGHMASTGGWSLSTGSPMDHYSAHELVVLTDEEWGTVERVASGIFRPCCNNPTHFPDCNHGMAMLGLLELMMAHDVSEEDMYSLALGVNSFWFPDTYLIIGQYMANNDTSWKDVDPKMMLSAEYSSGSGFAQIRSAVETPESQGQGGGCSV